MSKRAIFPAIIALSIVCVLFTIRYFYAAFPIVEVPIASDQKQAEDAAVSFLKSMGYNIPYSSAINISLETDSKVSNYLQLTAGNKALNQLINENAICVYYWKVTINDLNQGIKYLVSISLAGRIDGFYRMLPNEYELEYINPEEAYRKALEYIINKRNVDIGKYELSSDISRTRSGRTDYGYIWKRRFNDYPDILEEIQIVVQGNEIGFYEKYIVVPDAFVEEIKELESKGAIIDKAGRFFSFALLLGSVIVIIRRALTHKYISWNYGIVMGIVTAILGLIIGINVIPSENSQYINIYSNDSSYLSYIMFVIISSGLIAIQTLIYAVSGRSLENEIMYRSKRSNNQHIVKYSQVKNMLTKCTIGYVLASLLIAYHTAFYIIARHYGAWIPAKPRISSIALSYFPSIAVLGSACAAILAEEIPYRLFAISFLKKYLRITWLAIAIPSIIWASVHAGMIARPVYLRVIELVFVGIIYGIFFVRYGLAVCFIAHFIVNAIIGSLLLIPAEHTNALIIAALLLPMIVMLLISFLSKRKILRAMA